MAKAKDEGEELAKTTLRLPRSLLIAAKHRAVDEGKPLNDLINTALEQYLKSKGGRK